MRSSLHPLCRVWPCPVQARRSSVAARLDHAPAVSHAAANSSNAQYKPIAICTANALKRIVTAFELTEARCTSDWKSLAPSSRQASGSVIAVRSVAMATINSPPKTGRLSMQLACALASLCMKGDKPALSGVKALAGTLPRRTSCVRMASMSTSNSSVQVMKPVKAIVLDEIIATSSGGPDEAQALQRSRSVRAHRPQTPRRHMKVRSGPNFFHRHPDRFVSTDGAG